ncbi:hypothetical protein CHS0354_017099, partial [Potamilus streckersoni]
MSVKTSEFWKYVIDNNIGTIISLREAPDKDINVSENINIQLENYRVEETADKSIPGIPYLKLQVTHSEN